MNATAQAIKYNGVSESQVCYGVKAKHSELILFTTQLAVMLESGVVLSDAIEAIGSQMHPSVFRNVVWDIAERIKNGESFSTSLSYYPGIFDSMFLSMVKASEASGKMSEMLEVLSGYLDSDAETRKQVKSAMVYPIIMLLMAVSATGSLMFFVLPRFAKIYESKGAALPKLTQALVSCSSLLGNDLNLAVILTVIIGVVLFFRSWRTTLNGQKTIDWAKVKSPIFGEMFIDSVLTRNMRIMATMVNTGVSLLETLEVMQMSCGNYYFRCLWHETDKKIRDGYQLSESIMIAPYSNMIAPGVIQMLKAGEKSGKLGHVCDKVSLFYEKKLNSSIKTATSLIEPVMIIIMGSIIGTIAIALLLPVFRISSVMSH